MDTQHEFHPLSGKQKTNQPIYSPVSHNEITDDRDNEKFDMSWLFGVLGRRIGIMFLVAGVFSAISGALIIKNSRQIITDYEGRFRILVEPVTAESKLARQFLLAQNTGAELDKRVEETSFVDYETLTRVLKSPKLMMPLIKQLQTKYPQISYDELNSKLIINRVTYEKDGKQGGTKIVEVRYRNQDKEKILYVLGVISEGYRTYGLQERLTSINQGILFIDKQLPELQKRVDTLQGRLETLRKTDNVFAPEIEGRGLIDQSTNIRRQKVDNNVELRSTQSLYQVLEDQLAQNDNPTAVLMTEARTYERLLANLSDVNSALAQKSAFYRDDSAPVRALEKTQKELMELARSEAKNVILQRLKTQIETLEERSRAISEAENQLNQRLSRLSTTAREFADIQQELDVANDSLKKYLAKREALQIDAAQQEAPWQIILSPDIVRDPTGIPIPATESQTKRQLMLALVLSSLVGIAVGFLVEVLNTVFHTPEEARSATKLPLLGVIPFAKTLDKVKVAPTSEPLTTAPSSTGGLNLVLGNVNTTSGTDTTKPVKEAFRYLYTNIRLLNPQNPIRSFAIGSAAIGDGKSTVAVHLAQTAAAIGQRVLLVDADLRCPKIHTKLGLPNVRGLSDAIATDMGLNDVIQRAHSVWSEEIPGQENLFVLTAGSLPPDPIKLLSSNKMLYLMEQFQAFFDLVIYDTPPLVGLADANIIAAHTDGMVLVVSMEKTDRSVLIKAMEGLKISGASVLGLVANGAKAQISQTYTKVR